MSSLGQSRDPRVLAFSEDVLKRWREAVVRNQLRVVRKYQSNRRQPLSIGVPSGPGSERRSEPRTLESGWHSCFVTSPKLSK